MTTFHRSVPRTLLLIAGGLGLIAGSALMLTGGVRALPGAGGVLYVTVGAAGLLLFVPGVGRLVWQVAQRRPIVEIGPDGILDRRLSARRIPWRAVHGVGRTGVQRQQFVTLHLAPGAAEELLTGTVNRVAHRLNQRAGFRGVHLGTVGLRGTADEMYEAVLRHRRCGRRPPSANGLGSEPGGA